MLILHGTTVYVINHHSTVEIIISGFLQMTKVIHTSKVLQTFEKSCSADKNGLVFGGLTYVTSKNLRSETILQPSFFLS